MCTVGYSDQTIYRLWQSYETTEKSNDKSALESPAKRGRPPVDSRDVYLGSQLSDVHVLYLEGWLHAFKREGEVVTIKKLKSLLHTECNINASKAVIRKVLKRLGYQWGPIQKVGVRRKRPDLTETLREYLKKYAAALQKQNTGKYVIVYMDESYVHDRHNKNYTWFHPDSDDKNKVFCGTGKGNRLIIVHAITKDGLLYVDGQQRQHDKETLDENYAETAEWVFIGPVKKADYHKNMNGEKFMQWVKQRLIPAFQKVYKNGEKMILVLDNAPYHHCRGEDFVDPKALKRVELFNELLLLAKKTSMTIERNGQEVEVDLAALRKSKRGSKTRSVPTNDELREELSRWLSNHPEHQTGQLQKLFDELGFELLWTPPYTPTVQPIELCWAHCKSYVAEHFFTGRNTEQTRSALFDAFYGNSSYKGYTRELAESHIAHCHSWCDVYIQDDPLLSGDIHDLKLSPPSSSGRAPQHSSSSSASSSSALDEADSGYVDSELTSSSDVVDYLTHFVESVSAARMLDFDAVSRGDSSEEEEESDGEYDEFLEDDSFSGDDVFFGGVSLSDDESDDYE